MVPSERALKTESETEVKSDLFVEGCLIEIRTLFILKQKGNITEVETNISNRTNNVFPKRM